MQLSEAEKQKLAKVLALMESPIEGERQAAAETASRIINKHNLDWGDIIGIKQPAKPKSGHERVDPPEGWREKVDHCFLNLRELNKRDCKFIKNLNRYRGRPRAEQIDRVERIFRSLRAE